MDTKSIVSGAVSGRVKTVNPFWLAWLSRITSLVDRRDKSEEVSSPSQSA